jgi:glycosyltransferase involved in cell wall biosynthesis
MLADHIVCVSDFLAGQFAEVRPPVPMSTIHNGVDVDRIAANRRNPPLRLGPIAVGSIGHIIPQKRHVDVLAAAKIVKSRGLDIQFLFFGAPYPSERDRRHLQWLQRVAAEWGLESNLWIGHCEDDPYERYAQVDMMVFPGLNEGCSNGILEAMALGLPVIAAASGGNPELIEQDKTGVLVSGASPERLAAAIMSLSDDLQARERLGAAALTRVRQRFEMSQCAARYGQIYEALSGIK